MTDSPILISGDFAGRYTIERELGRGGTSIVYLANDIRYGRAVAIKVMRTELITEINTERFLREVRVTTRLEHPNIVPVLDSGECDRAPYFVLQYMVGGTLRDRLRREKQLSVAEVMTLGAKMARALQFAHDRNILHRDVKPENILFSEGEICLADFGIARALSRSTDESTTSTGIVRGTPAYMSPEQAAGDRDIDTRSDVYSLACVLYEALAGVPAFVGPSSQSVVAQRLSRVPPGVRVYRPTAPEGLERVLERALALSPVDRFQTAEEFAAALEAAPELPLSKATTLPPTGQGIQHVRRRRAAILLPAAAMVLAAWAWVYESRSPEKGTLARWLESIGIVEMKLDTTVFAVIAQDSTKSAEMVKLLRSRLSRWRELTLVDDAATSAAQRHVRAAAPDERDRQIAVSARAGRFVRVHAAQVGDSIEISAGLYDTRSNSRLVEKTVRTGARSPISSAMVQGLADALLLGGDIQRVPRPQGTGGTNSLRAWRAFLHGQSALEEGDLVQADSAFFAATRIDPEDAQSLIWLANVRSWMTNWGEHAWGQLTKQAAQAIARRGSVAAADSVLLSALTALDAKRYEDACPAWSRLTDMSTHDYAAWYGLANCLRRDPGVLRDPRSRTGWRFRTSYERAVGGFEQAFRLRPSMLRGFGGRSLADLQDLFYTGGFLREGRAIRPDTGEFRSVPVWQGDSLAFIATRQNDVLRGPWPDAVALAVQRQRERFHAIAQMWRAEVPSSVDAAEALAVSLEMLGDASAIDTMRYARTLARNASDSVRVAASEVLLRIKFSLPSDTAGLKTARALADTLLRAHSPSTNVDAQLLGSLAGLTGRAALAAAYATAGGARGGVPSAVAQSGPALLAFAAFGGPSDSLANLEDIAERTAASLSDETRRGIRARWIMRAALLAFPDYKMRALSAAARSSSDKDPQTTLAAALTGDADALRRRLAAMARTRANFRPADIKMEGLFLGASALASIGDTQTAIDWLDPTLRTLRLSASRNLANVVATGPLVRAMALRAKLADRVGDRTTARTWGRAVLILWSDADAFLQPAVEEIRRLTH